jgi:hypothetical protein
MPEGLGMKKIFIRDEWISKPLVGVLILECTQRTQLLFLMLQMIVKCK